MADQRMKAVVAAESGGSGSGSGSDEDEEARFLAEQPRRSMEEVAEDELELGLSLGRWRRGSSSGGGRDEFVSYSSIAAQLGSSSLQRWDLALSSSSHPYPGGNHPDWAGVWEEDVMGGEGLGLGPAGNDTDGDRDRDFQSKRPKVLAYVELSNYSTATSSGAEASVPVSAVESSESSLVKNEDEMGLCPMLNDDGYQKPCGINDDVGSDVLNTSDMDDLVPRMDLSEDLLHLVFSFLSQKDLCLAGATCKQWRVASMHEGFWRCLNFENTDISQQNFDAICHRYPNATEVNIFGVHNSDVLVMGAMTSLRRLETLILGKGQLGDGFFLALSNCPALKSLSICDSSLGSSVQDISIHHDRLLELHIMKCRVLRVSIRCHQLQSLSLRRTTMAHVSLMCPQLDELDIASCHKLSDGGIRTAVTSCHLLASLDMSSCSCVSDETLRDIAFACPNLSVLDASNCPNISLESVRLPMLIDLKLHSCEGITSASMSAISYSRTLEALQLDNCGLLTSVSLDLSHLRSISLVHCRKLLDLNLQAPVLSYIKVSNCSALHRISITSNALLKLVLQKQESLATLSLQCPKVQEVDLSDCESLTNSVCEVFSDGGGCPLLSSLVLDNCEGITIAALNSSSMVSLSLVGCHGMTTLQLSCPNLQKVNLDGCDHLESASFRPVGLESLNLGICPKLSFLDIEASKMSVLELKGCGVLSQASIDCPSLTSLDASFCRQLMDESLSTAAASCPQIESLVLSSCLAVGHDGLSSLHWLTRLTLLDLSYTFLTNLQPVFDTCLQLVILKLSACKYLTNSSLDALYKEGALPALRELDLSYSSIGESAIAELLSSCTNLVNVNLNGCANMHDLVWDSSDCVPSEMPMCISSFNSIMENEDKTINKPARLLEILNCIGCPNIKKVFIPSTAWCFHLSKLNLSLSANLKQVDIACPILNSLNLSNCSSLEILNLDCPRLTNLQLAACNLLEEETVEAAISQCTILETLNVQSCPKILAIYVGRLRIICPSLKRIQCGI